jgi:hypothetical protein
VGREVISRSSRSGQIEGENEMEFQKFLVFDKAYLIAPIRLSFGMSRSSLDLFFLEIIGDKDSPVRFEEKIVAFRDESLCRASLERLELTLPVTVKVEHKYDFICDIGTAIKLVTEDEIDRNAVVLNCINTLLDLTTTGPFDLPDEYRILRALADRLTFREEFGEFTQVRSLIRNALLWCAGIAGVELMIVQNLAEFETLLPKLSATPNR